MCFVCSSCDVGRIYCGPGCGDAARAQGLREAGARYRRFPAARLKAAARQAAFRERRAEKVTHQAPPEPPPAANLEPAVAITYGTPAPAGGIVCCRCGAASPRGFVRTGFMRARGRRLFPGFGSRRSIHDPPT